jgi:hypothetical protein
MFISNMILLSLDAVARQDVAALSLLSWWIGLLTLETRYSISGVLLPIAALVMLSPVLFRLHRKMGYSRFGSMAIGFALCMWWIKDTATDTFCDNHLLDVAFCSGAGGFPVLPLVSSGVIGFLLGTRWKYLWEQGEGRTALAFTTIFVVLKWTNGQVWPPSVQSIVSTLTSVSEFTVVLMMAMWIGKSRLLESIVWFLPVIGRYSLFSFIAHRVTLQSLALVGFGKLLPAPSEIVYGLYLLCTLMLVTGLCTLREHCVRWDETLRRLYL